MFLEQNRKSNRRSGWIEVITGCMFSGKTEELMRRLRRAQIAGQKVEIFKPEKDQRYDEAMIVSHDRNSIPSTPVPSAEQILLIASEFDVVGVDEAQFFDDDIVRVCNELANQGTRVIVAGLDLDYRGKPFGPMPNLLATAEFVTKVHAICKETGNLAHYSYRTAHEDDIVLLGEKNAYEPLDRSSFLKRMQRDAEKL
jgi:thymidine kinase